jgi:hypothetical protein
VEASNSRLEAEAAKAAKAAKSRTKAKGKYPEIAATEDRS